MGQGHAGRTNSGAKFEASPTLTIFPEKAASYSLIVRFATVFLSQVREIGSTTVDRPGP